MVPGVRDSSHAALSLHHNQSHYSPCAHCPWPVNYVLCQLNMTSLAKHFTASQIFSIMLKNLAQTCLNPSLNHCPHHHCESVHSNHAGTIGHCDVTIAGGRLLYRWRHKRSRFWIIRSSDGIICGFTSVKSQESHKWLVHRIHRVRNIG